MVGKKILILPDSHSEMERDDLGQLIDLNISNARYDWAGQLILDVKPDYVVDEGDFADMPSLSSYDQGKRSAENKRLNMDIEAAIDARERISKPYLDYVKSSKAKKKAYKQTEFHALGGNHEYRYNRLMNDQPAFYVPDQPEKGIYQQDVSQSYKYGWKFTPYQEVIKIQGFSFSHNFPSGIKNIPLGGENPAKMLATKVGESCVVGHSHVWDLKIWKNAVKSIMCLHSGCYFEKFMPYAGQANYMWHRGITILHEAENGMADVEFISMDRIKRMYR